MMKQFLNGNKFPEYVFAKPYSSFLFVDSDQALNQRALFFKIIIEVLLAEGSEAMFFYDLTEEKHVRIMEVPASFEGMEILQNKLQAEGASGIPYFLIWPAQWHLPTIHFRSVFMVVEIWKPLLLVVPIDHLQ